MFYPLAICKTASASSETVSAPQETEATQLIVIPNESIEGGEPHKETETSGGLNPEMPQETAKSTVSAQIFVVEELALLVQPLQVIPLADVSKGLEANPTRPPQEKGCFSGSQG